MTRMGLKLCLALASVVMGAARVQVGKASYYGARHGHPVTASGAPLRAGKMTAASPTLPLGTKAKVTNLETGKSVHVIINDRGPYAEGRVLDVSRKAADRLGMKKTGVATVAVTSGRSPPARRR
jgi:rare lipoprotein A